jgi:inositol polyphosphate-4-phosphatase
MTKSASHESSFKIPDVPRPSMPNGASVSDWAGELRPSMRKLRQGMDSLCKTARLVCSVLRLRQQREAVNLTHEIKYRRDVCFSQSLTALASALMAKFWAAEPDPMFLAVCTQLGPIVAFEGLVSMHGEDVSMFNDMIVAVEDLRNVEFSLIMVDSKRTAATAAAAPKRSHQVKLLTVPIGLIWGALTIISFADAAVPHISAAASHRVAV